MIYFLKSYNFGKKYLGITSVRKKSDERSKKKIGKWSFQEKRERGSMQGKIFCSYGKHACFSQSKPTNLLLKAACEKFLFVSFIRCMKFFFWGRTHNGWSKLTHNPPTWIKKKIAVFWAVRQHSALQLHHAEVRGSTERVQLQGLIFLSRHHHINLFHCE